MSDAQPVIVIGAGIGGLSAAIHLAAAGRRVIVLEQNPAVGGKMGELREAGFRWDSGPTVITMRPVLEDLFLAAGRRLEDYLHLRPIEPLTRYFYPDGTLLDATRDLPRLLDQIAALDARDVEGYLAFLAYAARLYRITWETFISGPPPTWRTALHVPPADALRIDGLRTMDQAIRHYVRSPHLRQMLGRFATYVGASPFRAPATLNVIAHVELSGGVWYPQGGIYRIAQAFARLADELGVEIRTGARVEQITVRDRRVTGVRLADGTHIPAGAVVANGDVAQVYARLLPPAAVRPARLAKLQQQPLSCSGFALLLGVEGTSPQLEHHNIFFSSDYRREFEEIFERGVPPSKPTIYVSISAKMDPADAPPGHENWFVLVNAPALDERWDWAHELPAYRARVLDRLAAFGFDVRDRLRAERVLTPADLERRTGAGRGALYGLTSNDRWAAFRRPPNRAPDIGGLYFAGGTAHPGGGVPMVTLSGRQAARRVLEDTP